MGWKEEAAQLWPAKRRAQPPMNRATLAHPGNAGHGITARTGRRASEDIRMGGSLQGISQWGSDHAPQSHVEHGDADALEPRGGPDGGGGHESRSPGVLDEALGGKHVEDPGGPGGGRRAGHGLDEAVDLIVGGRR